MGDTRTAVAKAAPLPDRAAIERASDFACEPFLREGEDPAHVLAPGVPRRAALDAARARLQALEVSNYTLAAHLRAATGGGGVGGAPPANPDVF